MSGFVENKKRPISTLIIAHPERAKSTEAKRFKIIGATEVQDLSAAGLYYTLKKMPEKEREIFHHIIVPDLEKVASRSKTLKEELFAAIRILAEEGLERVWVRTQYFDFGKRIILGFILCTTPEDVGDRRSIVRSYSFLTRFIPFTYDYSDSMKIDILEFIEKEESLKKDTVWIKREEKTVVECPEVFMKALNPYVAVIAKEIDNFARKSSVESVRKREFGVRLKENLITYLKSIALYDGHTFVRMKHFEEFKRLFPFMNFKFQDIDSAMPSPLTTPFLAVKGVVKQG
jgi:hypothetical protein